MRNPKHLITPPTTPFGVLPAVTLALAAAGILTSAHAQLQTAGDLLVNVDATGMPAGALTSIPNLGTAGGFFEARGGAVATPFVQAVYSTGTKGIDFNAISYLQHVQNLGDATPLAAPAGLVGPNPTSTVEAWVLNPWFPGEETVVSWGKRGGPDGSNKSLNYGGDGRWGSIGHWGAPDIGWDSCCNSDAFPPGVPAAGAWHHLVWTYDGTTTRVYSDGVLKNSETIGLDTASGTPITIAAQLEADGVTVTGGLRGNLTIARLRIHDGALSDAQVLNNYNFEKAGFSTGDPNGAPLSAPPINDYRFSNAAGPAAANAVITDSVGTAHGNVRGTGASFTGRRLVLPGGGSGSAPYVDLPNGLLSNRSVDKGGNGKISIEGFIKVTGARTWSRIFDFGSSVSAEVPGVGGGGEGTDYLTYTAQVNTDVNTRQLETRNVDAAGGTGGGGAFGHRTAGFNSDSHFVVTWDEATGEQKVYENGQEIMARTESARISSINDVNVWLGRSNWNGDANMQGEFDRFSIYDRILTDGEVFGNYVRGAEAGLPVSIISQPVSVAVSLPTPATFSVTAGGEKPTTYQWFRNGAAIGGATGSSYTVAATSLADNGATFYVVVQNSVGGVPQPAVTSATATLTVTEDLQAPTVVSAQAPTGNPAQFDLVFSEPVQAAGAGNLANYTASGFTISSVTIQNSRTVRFASSGLDTLGCKTLTVNGIKDVSVGQNPIAPNTQVGVVYAVGNIRYEEFTGIGGVNVADLLNNAKFPNAPDVVGTKAAFEGPDSDGGDNFNDYGARFTGFLSPPVSGAYTFYLAADDGAALWLSTDESPTHKVQIAVEPVWSGFRTYTGQANGGGRVCPGPGCNISPAITLQAGCKYYIEMIFKEAGGGDFGSVAWQTPAGGPSPGVPANGSAPIPGTYLSPFNVAPIINQDLADQSILDGRKAILTVDIFGTAPITYQWYRNGAIIDGATGQSYTTDFLRIGDSGTTFHVVAQNGLGTTQSRTATVTVLPDSTIPTLVSALGSANFDQVTVQFSEPITDVSAGDPFNWGISSASGSLAVNAVLLSANGLSVTLTTDPQTENTLYTVTASGLEDLAGNDIAAGASVNFSSWVLGGGGVLFESFLGIGGNLVTDLTGHPNFPNNPNDRITIGAFNSRLAYPDDSHEGYGARMRGLFIPPVSGNWVIFMAADDGSQLKFNPSGPNAAGAQVLLTRNSCCGNYSSANSQSAPQALVAGQGYYIEMLYKEGGGGDWGQLAARLQGTGIPPLTEWIPGGQLGFPAAPAGVGGPLTITTQPANTTVFEQTTYTLSVGASNPNGLPISYQWSRDGAPIVGATGPSYSALATLADSGATFSVAVSMIGAKAVSSTATLTVNPDTTAPTIVSAVGASTLDRVIVKFSELMASTVEDPFNYGLTPSIGVAGAKLLPDGMTVVLTLEVGALLVENTTYTVAVSGVSDRASTANTIAAGASATFSMVFAPNFLNFAAYHGTSTPTTAGQIPGNLAADLIAHPSFPDDPTERFIIAAFNSRLAYPNDSHERYGARITGVFVPPTSGNWILYMAADDGSQLRLNPTGLDPAGAQVLLTRDGCCGDYNSANSQSPPQALTAGTRYYIEMIYKEGGGGDWGQVAARLEGQPVPPISQVIGGSQIGTFVPAVPTTITITDQPDDITFIIDPLNPTGAAGTLLSQDFNSGDGGFTAATPAATFTGGFAYNAAAGSWQVNASDAEIGVPYTSRLTSPTLTVTKTGRARLTLAHRWSVEPDLWDGNQVRISVNGGAFVAVPASAFSQGGYDGTVRPGNSIITGQQGWTLTSAGHAAGTFVNSVAELGNFNAGDTVQLEFLYAGDTNTKGPLLPSWEINSVTVTEGGQDPVLRLTATVAPNQTLYYQWQRNNGAGWFDIAGATGPSLTLAPTAADNGAKFRALVFVPGTYVTSSEATLTVIVLNTPPTFTAGGDQTVPEDSGAQSVPWATGISPHSIVRVPVLYGGNFNALPPGSTLGGSAAISGGILHLTDALNSLTGSWVSPAVPTPIDSFTISFRVLVGGGTCCGDRTADGWSASIGNVSVPVTFPVAAEEGAAMSSGLAVNFDSWDNGGLDDASVAPNLDVKVGGTIIAYQAFEGVREGGRAPSGPLVNDPATGLPMSYKTGTEFANVLIHMDSDGTLDVDFKGVRLVDNVPTGLALPLTNTRLAFGARTGGANDNHWIDDLQIQAFPPDASGGELSQTVQFLVSNNNPSLFSVQPSIAPNGTLSYTPAPNAYGVATVTVVAKDSGGTVGGGDDTSNPVTFTITVTPVNDCPTAGSQTVSAISGVAKSITLLGADVDGDALQFAVSVAPAHGSLIVQPNGAATYQSSAGYEGSDSFRYTVSDGTCVPTEGIVNITVIRPNTAPTAKIVATPLDDFSPDIANKVVISCDGTNGCLLLDGSLSSDAESPLSDLTFAWSVQPGLPFATGVNASICLELGTHTLLLTVTDPQGLEGTDTLTVEVISTGEAIEELINKVNDSTIARSSKRPFIATLKAAAASADRGNNESAGNQLHAFQNKVRAQIGKSNPADAVTWIRWAQSIVDATGRCE